jgi:hypothetical protein
MEETRMETSEQTKRFYQTCAAVFGGILLGLAISKYSARQAYLLGFDRASEKIDEIYQSKMARFEEERKQSCLAWWFNDSAANIRAAQFYMCQNRRKWD